MDALLVTLTLVSLAVATTMSWVAWRTTREARRHEAARIAALAAAAGVGPRPAEAPAHPVARLTRRPPTPDSRPPTAATFRR